MNQAEIRKAIAAGQARFSGGSHSSKKINRERPPEEELHRACHSWNLLHENRYTFLEWMFHCPNGGGRSEAEAGMLKAMGVKAGVPDLMLPFPAEHWKGLAVELKSKDGVLSGKQRLWLQKSYRDGWVVGVARTLDTYISLVDSYRCGTEFNSICGFDEIFKVVKG